MKLFDDRIRDLVVGARAGQPTVLVDLGFRHYLPLHVLGDGICRALLYLTGVLGPYSAVAIFDEIDSGLHHSIMPQVWQVLLRFAKERGVQILATTHDEEMLRSLLPAFAKDQDKLRVIRLEAGPGRSTQIVNMNYGDVEVAGRANLDIR